MMVPELPALQMPGQGWLRGGVQIRSWTLLAFLMEALPPSGVHLYKTRASHSLWMHQIKIREFRQLPRYFQIAECLFSARGKKKSSLLSFLLFI